MEIFSKKDLVYTSCYCEENIWKFLKYLLDKNGHCDDLYAVFISNKDRMVPIWCQKEASTITNPVIWDYHVIGVHRSNDNSYVYDFDTILNFPEKFETYVEKSFISLRNLDPKYERLYRVIPARYYLENFASDRSHMIDESTGLFKAKPPKYECIKTNTCTNNIEEFIDMSFGAGDTKHGKVMKQDSFIEYFI